MTTLSDLSFPRKWGRVASGGLVAASCISDRDKEKVQLLKPWFLRSGRGYESLNNGS